MNVCFAVLIIIISNAKKQAPHGFPCGACLSAILFVILPCGVFAAGFGVGADDFQLAALSAFVVDIYEQCDIGKNQNCKN